MSHGPVPQVLNPCIPLGKAMSSKVHWSCFSTSLNFWSETAQINMFLKLHEEKDRRDLDRDKANRVEEKNQWKDLAATQLEGRWFDSNSFQFLVLQIYLSIYLSQAVQEILWKPNMWRVYVISSHQRMRELGSMIILVCDGNGSRCCSCQAHLTPRHVLGHNFQLISGSRQCLEERGIKG